MFLCPSSHNLFSRTLVYYIVVFFITLCSSLVRIRSSYPPPPPPISSPSILGSNTQPATDHLQYQDEGARLTALGITSLRVNKRGIWTGMGWRRILVRIITVYARQESLMQMCVKSQLLQSRSLRYIQHTVKICKDCHHVSAGNQLSSDFWLKVRTET